MRQAGLKIVNTQITQNKPRAQRLHFQDKISDSWEDKLGGIKSFVQANRKTVTEYVNTDNMGRKKRCVTMYN